MQNKSESKSRLGQYCSTKEFQSLQEHGKKGKGNAGKSSKKGKGGKSHLLSHSKGKVSGKTQRGNQNFNSVNLAASEPVKSRNGQHEHEHLKRETRVEERLKRNSSEKLIKTKSVSKLQPKSGRKAVSPSPISIRELPSHHEDKAKKAKNATSRSEKERKTDRSKQEPFLKKSGSKQVLPSKFQQGDRSTRNRGSIKTEMSSKTHSVIKQEDRSKRTVKAVTKKVLSKEIKSERARPYKMPKPSQNKIEAIVQRSILYSQVSFQQFNGEHPYESAFISNDKYYLPYPDLKSVKTQGCQVQTKQGRRSIELKEDSRRVQAAIKIQKVARGYITRKYIDQAKYIIGKAIIIQRWWTKVLKTKKERLNQKIVSASNSLITIKDFNDTLKTQKIQSQSKENAFSNRHNLKELIRNVLQENEQSDISSEQQKNANISRQAYVELKIQDEILSQRKFNFNSPKSLGSPCSVRTPTSGLFNIRELLGSAGSNEKQKIKEIMTSPRVNSPQQLKTTPQKPVPQPVKEKAQVEKEVEPFQTNFAIIEEFCLLTVNYFRDRPHEMDSIITKFNELKMFRTSIILKTWNSHAICEEEACDLDETLTADFEYLQAFQKPQLFSKSLREDIIHFPQIEIDLLGKRFNLESPQSAPVHRAFLQFLFDVMEEAFYQQNKSAVLSYGKSMSRYIFQSSQSLFQHYFSSALGELFRWGEVMCGLVSELPPEQEFLREQRMKEFLKFIETWDMGDSYKASMKIQASEGIVMSLVEEMMEDMVCFM